MNLGISNTQVATWKRIKTHHIVMAAGLALAVSAVISGVSLRNDASAPSTPHLAAPASISHEAPLPQSFVYVVGSQAEAAELTSAIANASEEAVDSTSRQVFVVDSLAAEQNLQVMQGELLLAGTAETVRVIDLRGDVMVTGFSGQPAGYVEAVTPEAELLSTGINPFRQTAPAGIGEYLELVTPEAEMLSTGMSIP